MTMTLGDLATSNSAFDRIPMLPGMTVGDYMEMCRSRHPALYQRLALDRLPADHIARLYAGIAELSTHFESKLEQGRGDSYRQAQNSNYLIRSVGFLRLFDVAVQDLGSDLPKRIVLDALGGNGTLTRIVRASRPADRVPFIVTNDVSGRMIESALAQDLPAIRLPLQDLAWFDDGIFDAVIVAYGTHHIPPSDRALAIGEACRVLKPGGRIVLQDFEIGSPTTRWYDEVLDRYTTTGHRYDYFTRQEFHDLLSGNGFEAIEVFDAYDPFILEAEDPKEARIRLLDYLLTLFALEKMLPPDGVASEAVWGKLEAVVRETATFDPSRLPKDPPCVSEFTVARVGSRYRAEIPRFCLAATGRKPEAA